MMIEIYTAKYCPFCEKAINLLFRKGASFTVVDVTSDSHMRSELKEKTGCSTIPQVFIDDSFIGGHSDLCSLEETGQLDGLIAGGEHDEE
jgi:glutaredoxin 3